MFLNYKYNSLNQLLYGPTNFKDKTHHHYNHHHRFRRGEVSYKMVVNSFVVMDEDNRKMFLGLGKDSVKRRPGLTQGQVDTSLFNATEDRSELIF